MSMDDLQETVLDSQTLFEGKMISLHYQHVQLANGQTSTREVVLHPGAVAILAEPQPLHLVFVQQYRIAPGETLLEIPAGKLETDETPADCAKRELEEETGYRCSCLSPVYEFYTSPGFANEKIFLFHATDLRAGHSQLDDDELLHVHVLHRDEVLARLADGSFRDAKTLVAVLWWLRDQKVTW